MNGWEAPSALSIRHLSGIKQMLDVIVGDFVVFIEQRRVVPAPAEQGVSLTIAGGVEVIVSRAAVEFVRAGAANQAVVSRAPVDGIVARPAAHGVVAAISND